MVSRLVITRRLGTAGCLCVSVAFMLALAPAARRSTVTTLDRKTPAQTTSLASALPPEFDPPILELHRELISIVVADVDADGDLDVVAADPSLDLFVWLNDGSGHLTRRDPSPSNAWWPQLGGPVLHNRAGSPEAFSQTKPGTGRIHAWTVRSAAVPALLIESSYAYQSLRERVSIYIPRPPPYLWPQA